MTKREWSVERDGTPYSLTVEGDQVAVSYTPPPEYHYMLSDHCSAAEFVEGKINDSVRRLFGDAVLTEALAIAAGSK